MTDVNHDPVTVLRNLADHINDARHRLKSCRTAHKDIMSVSSPAVIVNIKGNSLCLHVDLVVDMLAKEIEEREAELAASESAAQSCAQRALEVLDEPV